MTVGGRLALLLAHYIRCWMPRIQHWISSFVRPPPPPPSLPVKSGRKSEEQVTAKVQNIYQRPTNTAYFHQRNEQRNNAVVTFAASPRTAAAAAATIRPGHILPPSAVCLLVVCYTYNSPVMSLISCPHPTIDRKNKYHYYQQNNRHTHTQHD